MDSLNQFFKICKSAIETKKTCLEEIDIIQAIIKYKPESQEQIINNWKAILEMDTIQSCSEILTILKQKIKLEQKIISAINSNNFQIYKIPIPPTKLIEEVIDRDFPEDIEYIDHKIIAWAENFLWDELYIPHSNMVILFEGYDDSSNKYINMVMNQNRYPVGILINDTNVIRLDMEIDGEDHISFDIINNKILHNFSPTVVLLTYALNEINSRQCIKIKSNTAKGKNILNKYNKKNIIKSKPNIHIIEIDSNLVEVNESIESYRPYKEPEYQSDIRGHYATRILTGDLPISNNIHSYLIKNPDRIIIEGINLSIPKEVLADLAIRGVEMEEGKWISYLKYYISNHQRHKTKPLRPQLVIREVV